MNLLFIGNHFTDNQNNRNIWHDLSTQLCHAGHKVLITSRHKNKFLRLADMLVTVWRKKEKYELAEIDVFSGYAFIWAYLSGRLLKFIGKPFVLTLHGGNLPEFSKQHPALVQQLMGRASAVVAPSGYLLEAMQPYRKDIKLIPNAIDIDCYPSIEKDTLKPYLIWLRAFHQIYNPELAIRVLALLKEECPSARLIMIGPDKGDGSLERTRNLVKSLMLTDSVEFPGRVSKSEVPAYLNKGGIFINTTNFDNTPISVIEAMACGLCIVTTNVGGIPYLVEDGKEALLVPPNDSKAMAAAITRILREPDLAERLNTNARKKAEQFDWSIILPQWQDLFTELFEKSNN